MSWVFQMMVCCGTCCRWTESVTHTWHSLISISTENFSFPKPSNGPACLSDFGLQGGSGLRNCLISASIMGALTNCSLLHPGAKTVKLSLRWYESDNNSGVPCFYERWNGSEMSLLVSLGNRKCLGFFTVWAGPLFPPIYIHRFKLFTVKRALHADSGHKGSCAYFTIRWMYVFSNFTDFPIVGKW